MSETKEQREHAQYQEQREADNDSGQSRGSVQAQGEAASNQGDRDAPEQQPPSTASQYESDVREQRSSEPDDAGNRRQDGEAAEAEVLRSELGRLQDELDSSRSDAQEMRDRYLRARADLDNYRKRAAVDADRARDAGLDSAVMPVLTVYDDLNRALEAAETGDPASIVPGVQSVLTTLERNLDALGIKRVGEKGEHFDPDLHEALTTIPSDDAKKADTIAEVFQVGFKKGDRLVRPARVVVYQVQD